MRNRPESTTNICVYTCFRKLVQINFLFSDNVYNCLYKQNCYKLNIWSWTQNSLYIYKLIIMTMLVNNCQHNICSWTQNSLYIYKLIIMTMLVNNCQHNIWTQNNNIYSMQSIMNILMYRVTIITIYIKVENKISVYTKCIIMHMLVLLVTIVTKQIWEEPKISVYTKCIIMHMLVLLVKIA